jgi:drug/metabolite transporter (DMT)-like permease
VKERLGPAQLVGGALILSAMLLAELGPRWLKSIRTTEEDAIG